MRNLKFFSVLFLTNCLITISFCWKGVNFKTYNLIYFQKIILKQKGFM